jgi:NaMN:DMB phosphoribosyltransferase
METDHTQHLVLLGTIAANGQAFEAAVATVLGRTLGVEQHVAVVLAGYMQTSGVLNAIDSLTTEDEVKRWVKVARKASEARNKMIHGAWTISVSDPELKMDTHMQRGKLRDVTDRVAELKAAVGLLYEALSTAPGVDHWVPEAIE